MKNIILIIMMLLIGIFLVSCTSKDVSLEKSCQSDSDCVPASCCHAKEAVNSVYAPNCKEMFCTMDCEPGTLDCGQGEIKCVNKECVVVLK
ncbi:MAG: hypothetical protein WCV90_05475 [Candidatus Woesearchaeota archaeon]